MGRLRLLRYRVSGRWRIVLYVVRETWLNHLDFVQFYVSLFHSRTIRNDVGDSRFASVRLIPGRQFLVQKISSHSKSIHSNPNNIYPLRSSVRTETKSTTCMKRSRSYKHIRPL